MKKLVALVAGIMFSAAAFAEGITVGGRGLIGTNIGTTLENDIDNNVNPMSPLGLTAFAKIPLPVLEGKLALQPELGISSFGINYDADEFTYKENTYYGEVLAQYTSIDIPILVTYNIEINEKITISPVIGPKISIPVGKLNLTYSSSDTDLGDYSIDSHVLFGIELGAGLSYKAGPGAIYGDLRYDIGLTKLKVEDEDFATPRALIFSIGYGITL